MIDNWPKFILVFLGAGLISFLLTKGMIYFGKKFGILDEPTGDRKIHKTSTPLLGGMGIYLAFVLAIGFLWKTGQLLDPRIEGSQIIWFLVAGLVLVINGFLDDKYKLSAKYTIWGPIVASVIVIFGGLQISYITHPTGGVLYLDNFFENWGTLATILPVVITFLWLMGITYTTKLLDGIDGLVGSIGLIASLVIFAVSLS
ncbi:undecaprenyl/decaprenyl-phosphate alpha-N-acetylglucosaminyl 1-phosphate transferase, partial [Candidatus Parcubacteria bacterium]|nr:undecaprenyl/decaprenyl-phosphate alpha-N-acetylglucosaminyl 1-phosphate transferase [Candidatus Parcubacteria bacterium]